MNKSFVITYSDSVIRNKAVLFVDKNRYYNSFFLNLIYSVNIIGF